LSASAWMAQPDGKTVVLAVLAHLVLVLLVVLLLR
jgi:hypothetical protein